MPEIRELGFLTLPFAVQQCGRRVRVVLPAFAVEVDRGFPGRSGVGVDAPSSLRRKLLRLAQASSIVPSTVKCSSDIKPADSGRARTASKNAAATSPSSNRSRFFVNIVGDQIGSSSLRPMNQSKQDTVVDLLHQQPLAPNPIERLQQQRPQQLLPAESMGGRCRSKGGRTGATAA
jgi:hypothetical protein